MYKAYYLIKWKDLSLLLTDVEVDGGNPFHGESPVGEFEGIFLESDTEMKHDLRPLLGKDKYDEICRHLCNCAQEEAHG